MIINHFLRSSDVSRAIEIMHSKYTEKLSPELLAGKCNLSLYAFMHKFKAITGFSPMAYITRIRVNHAKDLLSNSSLSVSEVSNIIGYDNPLYFSRVFKKLTGMSPSAYKNKSI